MEKINKGKNIRLSKSCISHQEKEAVQLVLDREYLGMGQEVQRFEELLSDFFSRSVICVSSGTAALQLAIVGAGIKPGDEVLVPSLTYLASFQAISACGAIPIACDINEHNFQICLEDASTRISKKTQAIMPVHYSGGTGDLNQIYNFAKINNLIVIEDAAHAFGTKFENKLIGSMGDVTCFSFDGIKNITSGEGGCIVTDNKKIIDYISDARLLGVERDSMKRYQESRSWEFDVKHQGWRYHMSNIMAAIGIVQLGRFSEFSDQRQLLARKYNSAFKDLDTLKLLPWDYTQVVPHIYPIQIKGLRDRDGLQKILKSKNIQTGFHYQPNHLLSFYQQSKSIYLKNTENIFPELLSLPLHPDLTTEDVDYVAKTLIEYLPDFLF